MNKGKETHKQGGGIVYRLGHVLFRAFFTVFFRWKVYGRENVPDDGVYVFCSNHISWFDPPLVGCAVKPNRQVCFMAKKELFEIPVFKNIITKMGAFPVDREQISRQTIQHALDVLNKGCDLGLFPEGTRSKTGELQKPFLGASLIVLKSGKPVVPVAIKGPYRLFRPVKVKIGKPVYFDEQLGQQKTFPRRQKQEVSEKIMEEIRRLREEI